MKIKSFHTLYGNCCSQKLQNDEKNRHKWRHKYVKNVKICLTTFWVISTCLDYCICKVSSPYKVFNLFAVATMSEKTPIDLWGGVHPPPLGCHWNHLPLIWKIKKYMPEIILIILAKNLLLYLKRSQKSKKDRKGACTPHKSLSP